jgi:dTDP-4-dehydrorhamnose 3,5-epimerase-like enzyme
METVKHIGVAFKDARGEIYNLFEGKLGHVAMITSKKGSIRANHYHKQDHQFMYLISGAYDTYSCDVRNPEKKQVLHVKAGDICETPPYIAHAQKFTEDSVFLAFSTRQREEGKYEDDTIAYQVIEGYLNPQLQKK